MARCIICGNKIEGKRKGAKYCNILCRMKAYRSRKNVTDVTDNVTDVTEKRNEDVTDNFDTLPLFTTLSTQKKSSSPKPNLQVVFASFDRVESGHSFSSLIEGYATMRVLTYSNGVPLIRAAAKMLDEMEIVFGREDIINGMEQYLAYQEHLVNAMRKTAQADDVISRKIATGALRLFVVQNTVKHEKLYLLEGDAGTRVLTGSPNFSPAAFGGRQGEILTSFDNDPDAWEHFNTLYDTIKTQEATRHLAPCVFEGDLMTVNKLPSIGDYKEAHNGKSPDVVFVRTGPSAPSIVSKVIKPEFPRKFAGVSKKFSDNGNGMALLDLTTRKRLVHYVENRSRTEAQNTEEYLLLTPAKEFVLSGTVLDLNPPDDEIRRDVAFWIDYFSGYTKLKGDVPKLQKDYFTFMSWLYSGPLMCDFRHATLAREGIIEDYPVFGILYGKMNCGKTELINTLLLSMFGREGFLDKDWFTPSRVRALRPQNLRYPMAFDDLGRKRYAYLKDLVRDDAVYEDEYPPIVISMNNEQDNLEPAIKKRAMVIYSGASLPLEENREVRRWIKQLKKQIGMALYHVYLARLLKYLETDPLPKDILFVSSSLLQQLFAQYATVPVPAWCTPVTLEECDRNRFEKVRYDLREQWLHNQNAWTIRRNRAILNIGDIHAARRLREAIPDYLLREGSIGTIMTFDISELSAFLDMPIQTSWWGKITACVRRAA